jgi:hypothetical protein
MQQASADSPAHPRRRHNAFQALGPASAAINLCMWCAIPVFVLIWFMRARIKNEIATWS